MSEINGIIARAKSAAESTGLSVSTVSRKLFNDGKAIARLENGGQCTLKTLETAKARLAALEAEAPAPSRTMAAPAATGSDDIISKQRMTHLDRLEAEAIHIMREVVAETENPVMLYSIGKDSTVMLHLARKAFYPGKPPFPLMHIDTTWNFRETIEFRDAVVKELGFDLIVHINEDGLRQGITPFNHGSQIYTDVMLTQSLRQGLDKHGFDAAFGGGRRDEEKSRAKERILSFRSPGHRWDPKNQRPELWSIYNTRISNGQTIRAFPISNWTELDIWQYIYRENIKLPGVYFAEERPIIERDGVMLMVDDDRMPLDGQTPRNEMVRFRTLGCYPLTGANRSTATTLPEVIQEMLLARSSEREGRVIDHDQSASMEKKKQEGYF